MKHIFFFISVSLMFLLGTKGIGSTSHSGEWIGAESVFQPDASTATVLSVIVECPDEGDACLDVQSLARQSRVCGRGYRQLSVHYNVSSSKSSVYRITKRYFEILCHSIGQTFTSLPCRSWSIASDHYIFGMRRILI